MSSRRTSLASAEAALRRIPGVGAARVVQLLARGPTNSSYLVECGGERFVLRLDTLEAAVLGLDRENERRVCKAVAAAGLAPAYRYFDALSRVSLRPYVPGHSLAAGDLADRGALADLAAVLRRLHGVAPVGADFDPGRAARRYARQLGSREARELADRADAILADADPGTTAPVLCHNDLVSDNILRTEGQGLMLIDWEYAGVGNAYFDLAVVIRHHGLADDLARHFLAAYLQRAPTDAEWKHLARQCDFYGVLLDLWNQRIAL